jgi:superfamily II DNA helicase RecQ
MQNAQILEDFRNDPGTFVIIATVKFGMGIDIRHVDISVNLGLPDSAEAILQQNGRAGRNRSCAAVGITYVEASQVTAALNSVMDSTETKSSMLSKVTRRPAGHAVDPNLRGLVLCHAQGRCLVEEFNRLFGDRHARGDMEAQASHKDDSCNTARRRFPCSSCLSWLPSSQRPPLLTIQS